MRDLSLVHHLNLDALVTGHADERLLWDWFGGVLTWSKAAEATQHGTAEMREQLHLVECVLARYARTGRIGLTGPEYQLAKAGVIVMDRLSRIVDRATAVSAASWSETALRSLTAPYKPTHAE
ncbi:hypothetical protein [Eleftheria terrae]|uniref:hypothetical protein n=1 Tax=Eleftheria terrae TaxID=1597781 RepID=UPI00263A4033|nr:hypothetical protein [Eleftheria terrae]WKB52287.1 hypothetical protein N7L95_21225 [Eleftheria terrae]